MEVSAQHELFIEHFLIHGSQADAAEAAGYAKGSGYALFKKLRDEIQNRLQDKATMMQVKALAVVQDTMGEGATKAKQDLRLKAAMDVMDRGGLTRKQGIELTARELPAVMVLPAKDPVPPSRDTVKADKE